MHLSISSRLSLSLVSLGSSAQRRGRQEIREIKRTALSHLLGQDPQRPGHAHSARNQKRRHRSFSHQNQTGKNKRANFNSRPNRSSSRLNGQSVFHSERTISACQLNFIDGQHDIEPDGHTIGLIDFNVNSEQQPTSAEPTSSSAESIQSVQHAVWRRRRCWRCWRLVEQLGLAWHGQR